MSHRPQPACSLTPGWSVCVLPSTGSLLDTMSPPHSNVVVSSSVSIQKSSVGFSSSEIFIFAGQKMFQTTFTSPTNHCGMLGRQRKNTVLKAINSNNSGRLVLKNHGVAKKSAEKKIPIAKPLTSSQAKVDADVGYYHTVYFRTALISEPGTCFQALQEKERGDHYG